MSELTLVIDDDPSFSTVLVRTLSRRGHPARSAGNPDDALRLNSELAPARIVLDLNLAGSSGLALIAPLLEANPAARIVVLTGYASIATAIEAIKLGATHYLAKPVDADEVVAALNKVAGDASLNITDSPLSVDRLEWEHIQRVLAEHDGNVSATARALKMHRRTLQRKLGKKPVKE